MPVPSRVFPADPKANYLAHQEEIDCAIRRMLEGGRHILGDEEMVKTHGAGSPTPAGPELKAVIPVYLYGHPADMPAIHHPEPIHLQPAYRSRIQIDSDGLPHAERSCREIVSLPTHPQMTDEDASLVCQIIAHGHTHITDSV